MHTNGRQLHYLILLGGNLGDVRRTFELAIGRLAEIGHIEAESSVYCSEAWGFEAVETFCNQIVELVTCTEPESLLDITQSIERQLGRTSKSHDGHYASRNIDVDILFCGNQTVSTPRLTIPHPLLHKRRFTLVPLVERWPDTVHPVTGKTAIEMLDECPDNGRVWKE